MKAGKGKTVGRFLPKKLETSRMGNIWSFYFKVKNKVKIEKEAIAQNWPISMGLG